MLTLFVAAVIGKADFFIGNLQRLLSLHSQYQEYNSYFRLEILLLYRFIQTSSFARLEPEISIPLEVQKYVKHIEYKNNRALPRP